MSAEGEPGEIRYFGPLVAFDSDDAEFVRGAEIGNLMGRLRSTRDPVEQLLHSSNEEMLRRVAHAYGREYTAEAVDEGWILARLDSPTMPSVMDTMMPPEG